MEALAKESPEAEQRGEAPGLKKFENFKATLVKANCLLTTRIRSPRSGRRSTVKAILARGVVLEPREGAFDLVRGIACHQDTLVY